MDNQALRAKLATGRCFHLQTGSPWSAWNRCAHVGVLLDKAPWARLKDSYAPPEDTRWLASAAHWYPVALAQPGTSWQDGIGATVEDLCVAHLERFCADHLGHTALRHQHRLWRERQPSTLVYFTFVGIEQFATTIGRDIPIFGNADHLNSAHVSTLGLLIGGAPPVTGVWHNRAIVMLDGGQLAALVARLPAARADESDAGDGDLRAGRRDE